MSRVHAVTCVRTTWHDQLCHILVAYPSARDATVTWRVLKRVVGEDTNGAAAQYAVRAARAQCVRAGHTVPGLSAALAQVSVGRDAGSLPDTVPPTARQAPRTR